MGILLIGLAACAYNTGSTVTTFFARTAETKPLSTFERLLNLFSGPVGVAVISISLMHNYA